jgi:hypothetical protein
VPDPHTREDAQNFGFGSKTGSYEKDGHTVYLISMAIAPGRYVLADIVGNASAFPVMGLFRVPLLVGFTAKPHSIIYLGHITAKLRHREDGEFRAGPLVPLLEQAVAGMSTGTWDVAIEDDADKEIPRFRTQFPALASSMISDEKLPPFDRVKAQSWWDGQERMLVKVAVNSRPTGVPSASPVTTTAGKAGPASVVSSGTLPGEAVVPPAAVVRQSTSIASAPVQESAATAAIEPIAQSLATQLGCGAVQANGATTFIAPCDSYSVLIDCDGGQCRPMHTVKAKRD